jgi:hypothetical protein
MATIYKPAEVDMADFMKEAQEIAAVLGDMFAGERVKINVNPDALDVTTPEAGKWAGAQLIYDWLQRAPVSSVKHFICFGDNVSDYEMARYFSQQGNSVDFVFTGEHFAQTELDQTVNVLKTEVPYSEGTYAFLRNLQPARPED